MTAAISLSQRLRTSETERLFHRENAGTKVARGLIRLLRKHSRIAVPMFVISCLAVPAIAQRDVHVDPSLPVSPRPIEPQTEQAAVRDYLQSWKAMDLAFGQNRPDALGQDFVGGAAEQLLSAIKEQSDLGIQTHYQDISHDIRFLFYSPEGMSIEFVDRVKFNVQVYDHGRLVSSKVENTSYLVIMTPSEVRWSIRIFQAMQA